MKEQIKEYQSKLITLVDDIRNTTGATEVRISLNLAPNVKETRINLEFFDIQEVNPHKTNSHA